MCVVNILTTIPNRYGQQRVRLRRRILVIVHEQRVNAAVIRISVGILTRLALARDRQLVQCPNQIVVEVV